MIELRTNSFLDFRSGLCLRESTEALHRLGLSFPEVIKFSETYTGWFKYMEALSFNNLPVVRPMRAETIPRQKQNCVRNMHETGHAKKSFQNILNVDTNDKSKVSNWQLDVSDIWYIGIHEISHGIKGYSYELPQYVKGLNAVNLLWSSAREPFS